MGNRTDKLFAVIMAGGEGARFYPLSTPDCPKQFINFIGTKSFIRQSFERILPLVPVQNIFVSTSEKYADLIKSHLPEIPTANIIAEPLKKNTAPALIYTTALIKQRHGDVVVCCLPSDHYIEDEDGFRNIIKKSVAVANDGFLVTLGMKPIWPSTDLGYICPKGTKGDWSLIEKFVEKPNKDVAEKYISEGYLWNGGVFVWRASNLLTEVDEHAPSLLPDPDINKYFRSAQAISIDYAIMEKSKRVAVVPADVGWSDVGTWHSLEGLINRGVNIAPAVLSVMKGDDRCPWRRIVLKPWGHEEIWAHTDKYVGKTLFIKKGTRLSLQYHNVKDETLRLLSGEMKLELAGGKIHAMKSADVFHLPPSTIHRLLATTDCVVLEISTPEIDDVVRISDDYGRESSSNE